MSLSKWIAQLSLPYVVFSSATLVILVVIWVATSRLIKRLMVSRLERLERLTGFHAVPTSSPYREPKEHARAAARVNVRTRYTVVRNMLTAAALFVGILVASLPLLGTAPRAVLSFLVAVALAIVGIAARPLVENLISGVVISLSNQMKIGDTVLLDDEYYGTIEDINITHTVVKLWDWRRYIVPNSRMLQKEVVSYTTKDTYLWAYASFVVSARADLDLVERLACAAAEASEYNARFEPPQFWVREMNPGSVTCWIAAWAKNPEDAWYLRSDMRRELMMALSHHGIETHLDFHAFSGGVEPTAFRARGPLRPGSSLDPAK